MKHFSLILSFLLVVSISFCQTSTDNFIYWSSIRKLTLNDFGIKTKGSKTTPSFAQFTLDYEVNGFDCFTKNFNRKVHNYFIKSASWIDTTHDATATLKYQQTLFDISEIYARHFRKALKENRKKIVSGVHFLNELNARIMTEFSKRRMSYELETNTGEELQIQADWETQIQKELDVLKEFSSEKGR
jgi:hypothetical protein